MRGTFLMVLAIVSPAVACSRPRAIAPRLATTPTPTPTPSTSPPPPVVTAHAGPDGAEEIDETPPSSVIARSPGAPMFNEPLPRGAVARMGTSLLPSGPGHLAYAKSGAFIVTDAGRTLVLWNPKTGLPARRLAVLPREVRALALSPDGRSVAVATMEEILVVEVTADERAIAKPRIIASNHDSGWYFTGVAWSPDGRAVAWAASSELAAAGLVDPRTGSQLRTFRTTSPREKKEAWGDAVAFSADGQLLAANLRGGDVGIWRTDTGAPVRELVGDSIAVRSLAFSPDARTLFVGGDSAPAAHAFDVGTGRAVASYGLQDGSVAALAVSPDGTKLVTSRDVLTLWDVRSTQALAHLDGRNGDAAFSPDGAMLVWTRHPTAGVGRWDVARGVALAPHVFERHERPPAALAFTDAGATLVGVDGGGDALVWRAADGKLLRGRRDLSRWWSWTDGALGVHTDQKQVELVRLESGAVLTTRKMEGVRAACASPDGTRLVVAHAKGADVIDIPAGRTVATLGVGKRADRVALSGGGARVAVAFDEGVVIADIRTGALVRAAMEDRCSAIALSYDGARLACASGNEIALFEVRTGRELRRTKATHVPRAVAFSSDGTRLATAGDDVVVWNVATLRATHHAPREVNEGEAWSLAFTPDGKRLAVGGGDGAILVWTVADLPAYVAKEEKP